MAPPVPSMCALRVLRASIQLNVRQTNQIRHATLLRRPKRPYTFTQLITLSDGSAFTIRTTNPQPVYKCAKDTRNTPLWNPSSQKLMNVEQDEAGKLAAFRSKFGKGWDAKSAEEGKEVDGQLMDLISGKNATGMESSAPQTTPTNFTPKAKPVYKKKTE